VISDRDNNPFAIVNRENPAIKLILVITIKNLLPVLFFVKFSLNVRYFDEFLTGEIFFIVVGLMRLYYFENSSLKLSLLPENFITNSSLSLTSLSVVEIISGQCENCCVFDEN
jgi:hypothetical protein